MSDARQEQDMPETATPDGREQSPPGTENVDVGVRIHAEMSAMQTPSETEARAEADPAPRDEPETQAAESHEEEVLPPLDGADETGIREFARSVMSGLEDAGIDIEAGAEHEERALLDLPEGEGGYFAGWDGFLADERQRPSEEQLAGEQERAPAAEPAETLSDPLETPLVGTQSLAEIGAAAALAASRLDAGAGEDLSIKHDELADAVQSALSSIYGQHGDSSPAIATPAPEASAFNAELQASAVGWDARGFAGSADGALTPQEVILNYFSYDASGKSSEAPAANRAAAYERGADEDFSERDPFFSSEHQTDWPSPFAQQNSYDGPPSYPAPVVTAKAKEPSERENSRLLGAAAIGLIGGIAIAASLAVFVINSYGPGGRPGSNASSRALDAASQGYGREIRTAEANDAQRGADVFPVNEQALSLAVSDAVATAGQVSPLSIAVKPEASAEQALVSITGVPEGVRLNAGVDAGGGNWLLPPYRLKGLSINVSSAASAGAFQLGAQIVDSNVRTPLTDMKQFTLRVGTAKPEAATLLSAPRSAAPESASLRDTQSSAPQLFVPPSFNTQTIPTAAEPQTQAVDANFRTQTVPGAAAQQPSPPKLTSLTTPSFQQRGAPQTEIEDLIREGNKRMREGDIVEARALYQKAVVFGDADAALAMGRSYDPIYFSRIDKKNAEPDAAKAFDWYRKAMDAGAAQTAKVRIENLKHFLNE